MQGFFRHFKGRSTGYSPLSKKLWYLGGFPKDFMIILVFFQKCMRSAESMMGTDIDGRNFYLPLQSSESQVQNYTDISMSCYPNSL